MSPMQQKYGSLGEVRGRTMSLRPIGAVAVALAVLTTACTTTGEIEGHRIRGADETPAEKSARESQQDLANAFVRVYGTSPEEQARGRYSNDPVVQAAVERILVGNAVEKSDYPDGRAPRWFRDYWQEYLGRARETYAVLAVDRNLRAVQGIYCGATDCHRLLGAQHQSFKDVHYKHEALERCRAQARENFPAEKPDCALYAIGDKVVWRGRLPWH